MIACACRCATSRSRAFHPRRGRYWGRQCRRRCRGPEPWTIYVRTSVSAAGDPGAGKVAAAQRYGYPGRSQNDRPALESAANGVILDPDRIVGMELTGPQRGLYHQAEPVALAKNYQTRAAGDIDQWPQRPGGPNSGKALGMRQKVNGCGKQPQLGQEVEGTAHSDGTVSVP